MSAQRSFGYVPALDGLRALAVGAVLVFHGELGVVEGGFLGVSVFFTLSGFLITSLLLVEHEQTGTISLRAFFARRARRLVPAAYACVVLVLLLGVWWGAVQRRNLPGDIVASVLNVANWRFAFAGSSYQDLFIGGPSPLAHFWSLAIEEQSYLVLPLLAWWALKRGRRAFGGVLVALLTLSIIATLATTDADIIYYGTHTRAAELLVGALLALAVQRTAIPRRWSEPIGWAGLAALVAAAATARIDDSWLYDGGLTAVSIPSAAVIIGLTGRTALAAIVSRAPLVAMGKVSYGLYLFHWPCFLVLTPQRMGFGGVWLFIVRVAVTAVLTVGSYHLLEQPVRLRRVFTSPRLARSALGVGICSLLVLAAVAVPAPNFTPTEHLLATDSRTVVDFPLSASPSAATDETSAAPDDSATMRVLVVGTDSTPIAALRSAGWDVIDGVQGGCQAGAESVTVCEESAARWTRLVLADEPDVVVVALGRDDAPMPLQASAAGGITTEQLRAQSQQMAASGSVLRRSMELLLSMGLPLVLFDGVPVEEEFDSGLDKLALLLGIDGVVHRSSGGVLAAVAEIADVTHSVAETALRLLVIGDSTSLGVAQALSEGSSGRVHVTWAGANGCPFVRAEAVRPSSNAAWRDLDCDPFDVALPRLFDSHSPDLVLLVVGPMELVEQRYPGDPEGHVAGDPEFVAFHDSEMAELVRLLRPAGVPLVVADSPALSVGNWSSAEMVAPDRLAAWNSQVARWDAAWSEVSVLPYASVITEYEAQHGSTRSDGVHPDVAVLVELARASLVDLVLVLAVAGRQPR